MNQTFSRDIGDQLQELIAQGDGEIVLVAPFVKVGALRRLLWNVKDRALVCITRWSPDELVSGVSDLEAYKAIEELGGTFWLRQDLHAKYFRVGSRCLIGSPNITHAALGWSADPNLELLVEIAHLRDLQSFERELRESAIAVDDGLYLLMKQAVEDLVPPAEPPSEVPNAPIDVTRWLPTLRSPEQLYGVYRDPSDDAIPLQRRRVGSDDLLVLRPPPGMDEAAFENVIGAALLTMPIVRTVDRFITQPRRFGEVTELLTRKLSCSREEAQLAWQTLLRWLTHFLPNRYRYERPGYSESLVRVDPT